MSVISSPSLKSRLILGSDAKKTHQHDSGFTKLDWESWVGVMSNNPDDWNTIMDRIYQFAHTTPDRVPLTDWYWASTGRLQGFIARPVLGAVYAKLLLHNMLPQEEPLLAHQRRRTN